MKYAVTVGSETFTVEFRAGEVLVDGTPVQAELVPDGGHGEYRLFLGDRCEAVSVHRTNGQWRVQVAGEHQDITVLDERVRKLRELTGGEAADGSGETLKAPMPGMVLRVEVEAGNTVEPGQGILVLEAMKMENEIRAGTGGVVKAVLVEAGTAVEKGTPLVEIGPAL